MQLQVAKVEALTASVKGGVSTNPSSSVMLATLAFESCRCDSIFVRGNHRNVVDQQKRDSRKTQLLLCAAGAGRASELPEAGFAFQMKEAAGFFFKGQNDRV